MERTHINIPTLMISVVLIIFAFSLIALSFFTGDDTTTAFHFPQLLAIVFAITVFFSTISDFFAKKINYISIEVSAIKRFTPGFVLVLIYVNFAETLGFYPMTLLFLVFTLLYYNQSWNIVENGKRLLTTDLITSLVFCLFVYLLFTLLLKVQIP